ncbi:MAG: hypothetical protein JWQ27_2956 [Ferruginibacter sp.]|nr:hypothetical protein [Ferruginibacter sp.]
MKKSLVFFLCLSLCSLAGFSQFYYKDIISNKELLASMASYRDNKIHTVNINSFEDDGSASDGFFCQKKISKDYKKVTVFTRSNVSGASEFTSIFNDAGLLQFTTDSSAISLTKNSYSYDEAGRIKSIVSSVKSDDDDFTNEIREEHLYFYDDKGQPEKMVRIKNRRDSTNILFAADEKGNIGIEKDSKSGTKFFYYYDAKKRLTDIVQSNDFRERLHPDYLFEYNGAGLLTQMTTTEEGGNDYYVWKYTYDNGLRVREKLYSKERKLMGSIEYEYK